MLVGRWLLLAVLFNGACAPYLPSAARLPDARSAPPLSARVVIETLPVQPVASKMDGASAKMDCLVPATRRPEVLAAASKAMAGWLGSGPLAAASASRTADYRLRVGVDAFQGCRSEITLGEALAAGLLGGVVGQVTGSLASGDSMTQAMLDDASVTEFGLTYAHFALVDREDAPIFAGYLSRIRAPRNPDDPLENAAEQTLVDVGAELGQRVRQAVLRDQAGVSPYGNLGARCLPRDAPPSPGCPRFVVVVASTEPPTTPTPPGLASLGLPRRVDGATLDLADLPEGELTVYGVFEEPDEATFWIRGAQLLGAVRLYRSNL